MKDWQGKDVNIGTRVSYVVRYGSSQSLIEAEVVELKPAIRVKRLRVISTGCYPRFIVKTVEPKVVKLESPLLTVL